MTERPPRWAAWMLARLLKRRDRETVIGDLLEEYREDRLPKLGHLRADLWYFRQALSLACGGVMKIVLTALCLFCLAASIWLGVMENILRHPGFLGRTLLAGFITAQSAAAIFGTSAPRSFGWRVVVMVSSVAVLAIGINALVKVSNAAHFEGYVAVIGLACVLQATLTLLLCSARGHTPRHPNREVIHR